MTTTNIPAIQWQFEHDVDDAVSAGRFRATYRAVTSAKVWDPTIFNGVHIYQRQDSPDFIRITMSVEGTPVVVVEGVCDQHIYRDTATGAIGTVAGRDKMAILLDRRPTGSFIYNLNAFLQIPPAQFTRLIVNPPSPDIATILYGSAIINGQPAPNTDLYTAINQLMQTVNVPVIIHPGVPNYSLGPSITVTRDKSYAEYLAQLLRPLRLSEKHRVDALADPVTGSIHIIQRDNVPYNTVTMGHACFKDIEFEKTGLPNWPTVRFQGFSWRSPVRVTQGVTGLAEPIIRFEENISGASLIYTLETVTWPDAAGLEVEKYEKKTYTVDTLNGALSGCIEETLTTKTYNETLGSAGYGLLQQMRVTVQKTIPDVGGPFITKDTIDDYTYWTENIQPQTGAAAAAAGSGFPAGSLQSHTTIQLDYSETGPVADFTKKTTTVETISQSSNQVIRSLRTIVQDASGNVTTTQDIQDVGPFKIVGGKGGQVQGLGTVMTQMWIESGPLDVAGVTLPFVVNDEMIADQTTANQIHDWLVDEYASIKVRVHAMVQPDIRIRPGRIMAVTGAPSSWPVTSWYITAVRMVHEGFWTVEGTAWLVA